MIKKLKQRIFLLIMLSLSIIMLGTIVLLATINYNNTMNTTIYMINKFADEDPKRNHNILEDYKIKPKQNIDEQYRVIIHKSLIKTTILFSVIIAVISIVIIYIIAKKLSNIIVKPVEETFEKQKQFISDASHELKTPLSVIEANTDVLQDKVGENKWINYIQNEVESMNKLINELLLLAKIENIDNIKKYSKLNLSKEIEIILSMFESLAYENEVTIKTNIADNIMFNGNREDIEHIISTLTDNAIKHTEVGKEIIVNLKMEKNDIILEIKNIGEPIQKEEREKIFERFYRIDKSRNRKEKRYGLGLSIAKATVEKYNGKIEVDYKNNFTIFRVIIPN